jgi:hypothetical protein
MSKAPKATTNSTAASTAPRASKTDAALTEFTPGRWAVIMKVEGKDSREEVIDIKQMAPGAKPSLYGLADTDDKNTGNYSVEQIPDGVIIGMRRGGEFESADGFGWRDAEDKAARGGPIGSGAVRLADVEAS